MLSVPVRGVKLVYEVLGKSGPWVVISPGGRRGLASDRALGVLLAEAGFRVLVYDRRNTGASEIGFPGHAIVGEEMADGLDQGAAGNHGRPALSFRSRARARSRATESWWISWRSCLRRWCSASHVRTSGSKSLGT